MGNSALPTSFEAESAIASVLALAAMSDGSVSTDEIERLVVILRKGFNLEGGSALKLMTDAIRDLPQRGSMSALLDELNRYLSVQNKEEVAVMILEVIAADGRKEASEMEVLAHAVYGLGLSTKSMNRAYERYFASRRGKADQARGRQTAADRVGPRSQ